jgi:uncharacterized protein YdeI (YjbR/CyaY-like superfamily)/Tat protein secretion system quality control protein TatD with DNase activity
MEVNHSMETLPPLDAHAHLDPDRSSSELADTGAVLAMTLSLDEAARVVQRYEPHIAWGVGCHPRKREPQESFDAARFRALAGRAAIIGEIGLDTGSRVPLELQLQTFRQALAVAAEIPRLVSIHSYRATGLVTAGETQEAVALGCYFSIHSAVARHSKFRTRVPPERVLIESDHGYRDPPAAIPCRVEWVEHLVGQQLNLDVKEVRRLAWRNLATIIHETGTRELFPEAITEVLVEVSSYYRPMGGNLDAPSDHLDFKHRDAWRAWLSDHHATEAEAWLVIQKKRSQLEGLSLDEAVEEALCYGWIDGTLRTIDDQRYLLRFSPRRRDSVWSVRNITRVEKLTRAGKMTDEGFSSVREAKESGQWQAALDRERTGEIPPELEAALRRKEGALAAYRDLPASKKKQYLYWLGSAKRERTKRARIEKIVEQLLGS